MQGCKLIIVAAAVVASGCYTGVEADTGPEASGDASFTASAGADDDSGGEGGSEDGGETDSDDGDPAATCDTVMVGFSPLRRLTRSQYNNAIRDLLGIDTRPGDRLSPDEKTGAFFSNGTAPVTELLAEQYMRVAEEVAEEAMPQVDLLVPCADPATCGADFVETFGGRAFRRPLTGDERDVLLDLFEQGRAQEGLAGGLRMVVQATLQSPQFLYHLETGLPDAGEDVVALEGYELASRLSFFLWDSTPDDALLDAAGDGSLGTPEALRAQAERLLDDPRAADSIQSFHRQWLHIESLGLLEKDPEAYPTFSPALSETMAAEPGRFADWVIREDDGRLETLFTASYSFVEGPLFELYGIAEPPGHDPSLPVELDPTQRAGLLTQPGVLAMHSHADQSSPVQRGKLVRENFLCQPLAPPPPEVDVVPPPVDPNATTRERFDQHRSDPACAACHILLDPLGFGFEHYDGIGAWRDLDAGQPVDASGEVAATDVDGPFVGAVELAHKLAGSDIARTCVAHQWFSYSFGRTPAMDDECSFDELNEAFAATDYNIRELLLTLVTTDAFRNRRVTEGS